MRLLLIGFVFFWLAFANNELLEPYSHYNNVHGPKKTYSQILKQMKEKKFGIYAHEIYKVAVSNSTKAIMKHKTFSFKDKNNQIVNGHFMRLDNPMNHFSFLEPLNGCGNGAEKTSISAKSNNNFLILNFGKTNVNFLQMLDFSM